jgi:cyclopropane fatty-acyl-phospholipid synthase-like methyltransferase
VNLYNANYNPRGILDPTMFQFPTSGARFDVALAVSVFTHLLPETATHYIQELARVMKPGGRALLTFFLLNDSARSGLATGTSTRAFRFPVGPGR